jgi:ADP-L-glycero-D-manno-heptose 6-epimerase
MILITGEKGFIGSELYAYLAIKGEQVVPVSDIVDAEFLVHQGAKVSWVFHMGAISETNARDWEQLMTCNIQSTQDWAIWCERTGCGLTYASSASIYGPWVGSAEWGPMQPQHLYGVSKLSVDAWMQGYKWQHPKQGMRFFNVYGRNEGHKAQPSPVRRFIEQAITQKRLTVWHHEGRLGFRDFISVDDCIDAMMRIRDSKAAHAGSMIYNIGTGHQLSFMDIANSIQRKVGAENLQVQMVAMPEDMVATYQWESLANITRLRELLPDWVPRTVDQWLDDNFDALYNKINEEIS